jgi:hypothetical protein
MIRKIMGNISSSFTRLEKKNYDDILTIDKRSQKAVSHY